MKLFFIVFQVQIDDKVRGKVFEKDLCGLFLERAANTNKLISYKCTVHGCEKVRFLVSRQWGLSITQYSERTEHRAIN